MDGQPDMLSGYCPGPLHLVVLWSDLVGRIPPGAISPALMGMAAISAWPWQPPLAQALAGGLTMLGIAGDWVSLAWLPRKGRSFGPVTPSLLALALVRAALTLGLGLIGTAGPVLGLGALLQLALTGAQVYATWVEPFHISVTCLEHISPKLSAGRPLRVLHLSDIHFEGWTPREQRLLEVARELTPDLVLLTGDYLSLSSVEEGPLKRGPETCLALWPPWPLPMRSPAVRQWTGPGLCRRCLVDSRSPGCWTRPWYWRSKASGYGCWASAVLPTGDGTAHGCCICCRTAWGTPSQFCCTIRRT